MADSQKLTGAQRASVLLLSLGEQDAAAVLKHMDAREVQAIGTAMATLKNVSRDDADAVLDAFAGSLGKQTSFGIGTEDYVRNMLTAALGEDTARFARLHRDIIERFGRFPHRNPVLGRATTSEEQRFLDEGGFAG